MGIMNLIAVEARRALNRRLVRVLVVLALVGIAGFGSVAFFDSSGNTIAEMKRHGHPAVMADWWTAGGGDGILLVAVAPLLIGGLFGGASVAGAEWRAGTVAALLTWEPRRLRLHAARAISAVVLAAAIAAALQILLLVAALPAVLANGATAGVDGEWWASLVAAVCRISLLTGAAALLGLSLATLGRNTGFALGAAFGWMAVGENLVRNLKPSLGDLLVGENLAIVVTWAPLEGMSVARSEWAALVTLLVYVGLVTVAAGGAFVRRDIGAP